MTGQGPAATDGPGPAAVDDAPAGHVDRALRAATLADAFDLTAEAYADRPALTGADGERYTWARYRGDARRCAAGLAGLGLRPGDTLGLLLGNRPEFHVADAAAMTLGVTTCSLYPTAPDEELRHLVTDSRASVLVCDAAGLARARGLLERCPGLRELVVVGPAAGAAGVRTYQDLLAAGDAHPGPAPYRVRARDVLTVVYTSGTTGPPKGVEISHGVALATARAFLERAPLPAGSRLVSYLPMAHIAERCCSHYLPMLLGADVTCCPQPDRLFTVLPQVRPHWLFSVPRMWDKLRTRLLTELDGAPAEFRDGVLRALELGAALAAGEDDDGRAEYLLLERSHLAPVRALLGLDEARLVHVGAAPIREETMLFLRALGLPVGEIWGMTELCAAACVTEPGRHRMGWVGPPLPGVEVRTAPDGEVLVRGAVTMLGYRGRPQETAAAFDEHGWLRTGDLGELAPDGSLRITGRKKDLIVNAYGKNMAPARIEARIAEEEPLIDQVCVIGDGRPFNVALIATVGPADPDALRAAVGRANLRLSQPEQIKRFAVVEDDWTPRSGLVTPTLKLRRSRLQQHYREVVASLYADGGLTPLKD
jgi:long-subunit acyl-CoA synthetase (AMP-forming)